MSALAVEHGPGSGNGWDEVVRIWEETDAPEGCKVEIIEGIVTVAPSPSNEHNDIAERLHGLLYRSIPADRDWGIYQTQSISVPERVGLFIPDLLVLPRAVLRQPGNVVPAGAAELVVEITSRRNANHDRVDKLHGYASAEVPFYLLLDPWHSGRPTATLHGEPRKGKYTVLDVVKFGDPLHLPAPFDLTIDTSVFPLT
ncbi:MULTISPECIES: Uma2 family endonuclease [Streptomycetaceae]|uniref:Putative restriction endonuclease domain-containing protein n=1 Tax=Streptantibioticus cattleyicolor (strain ATCC 35852 / DSM 46488 / JCM 4925 / NBRC 14057 / NRRL 8057) TaxID=1003195 RepID=F8K174_STREN|nr:MULTISPECIES: Uma2 family endonuclease [Streptomycetaceae]AEW96146.1 protein of unknown function DUF820 [Streptantibioticus cattleyicolor NRRL 8057 = DSM 46488]MYS60672.1 Uma2 family endonuclease [Streptomyces sp. SID5468]CCB76483.1 conserved protein of unknown function [Streptantibioticus cattleyicolor NRRL 8057 = DSM 46488]